MKEKVQEFDIDIRFHFDASMTIEAESDKEALRLAQKYYFDLIKDHLRDKSNLNITVKSKHVITEEEREKLESEGIIEPRKLTTRQQAKLEKEKAKKEFFARQQAEIDARMRSEIESASLAELRKRRSYLNTKIKVWSEKGKDVSGLVKELNNIELQINKKK